MTIPARIKRGQRKDLFWLIAGLALSGISGAPALSATDGGTGILARQFQSPPRSAKPLAYWWWLNGHTDEATITSDLEAMRREGFGGAILMDANGSSQGGNLPVTPGPTFGSPAWQRLFLHTLQESSRLGLRISLTIQSGWNVGGPSVTPEQSAKLLTWSRQIVRGPRDLALQLAAPPAKEGFYRDIAVLAYPLRHGAALAGDAAAGDRRHPIRDLQRKAVFVEAGFSNPDTKPLLGDYPSAPGEADTAAGAVIDLSSTMTAAGKLVWTAPAGDWEVLRIGYTSSDARVSTASGAWQGLVIDYLDRNALLSYWDTNIQPLLDAAGPYLGKSLAYVYTDSWEVGGVNWTSRFRQAFSNDRGYDPLPYLPVVAGRIVTDRETSDRFLNDFRRTIGDLVLTQHYRVFGELAAKNGLGFHPESGGPHGAPVDALRVLGASTFPQMEFWAPSKTHRSSDQDRFFVKEASSAAHIYGKTLTAAEGLTSIGPQWQESPGMDLKPAYDQAVCAGLNLMVWHQFTSSPKSTGLPGQEYFAGTHFNPKVTWFRDGKAFFDYMGRVQLLMQQGLPVSDVLYYYGDQVPNFVQFKAADPAGVLPGYDYDVVDEEVLTTGVGVRGGRLRLANGTEYRELVLPPLENISLPALRAIDRLVREGATVVGAKPTRLTGLPHAGATDADVVRLANRLWAGCGGAQSAVHRAGAGTIVCGESARAALQAAGVSPDLRIEGGAHAGDFDYVHRRAGKTEIYFVRNTQARSLAAALSFRVHGLTPEIWNAETGQIAPLSLYRVTSDARTSLPAWFAPYGSMIVVFRKPAGPHLTRIAREGQVLFPSAASGALPFSVERGHGGLMLLAERAGRYTATDETGRRYTATVAEPLSRSLSSTWTLAFTPGWGAPAQVSLDRLSSWSESHDLGIRYYSGSATYATEFDMPAQPREDTRIELDLGEVHETARVWLNGKEAGVLWKMPYSLNIGSAATAGRNALTVEVTNLWPNRLIGDQGLPANRRFTHTNITKFSASSPLLPSGLLGPVRVSIRREVPLVPE